MRYLFLAASLHLAGDSCFDLELTLFHFVCWILERDAGTSSLLKGRQCDIFQEEYSAP